LDLTLTLKNYFFLLFHFSEPRDEFDLMEEDEASAEEVAEIPVLVEEEDPCVGVIF